MKFIFMTMAHILYTGTFKYIPRKYCTFKQNKPQKQGWHGHFQTETTLEYSHDINRRIKCCQEFDTDLEISNTLILLVLYYLSCY